MGKRKIEPLELTKDEIEKLLVDTRLRSERYLSVSVFPVKTKVVSKRFGKGKRRRSS